MFNKLNKQIKELDNLRKYHIPNIRKLLTKYIYMLYTKKLTNNI